MYNLFTVEPDVDVIRPRGLALTDCSANGAIVSRLVADVEHRRRISGQLTAWRHR